MIGSRRLSASTSIFLGLLIALVHTSDATRPLSQDSSRNLLEDTVAIPTIIGGNVAQEDRYPYMAVVFSSERPYCSGALIHPQIVVTAGHCIRGAVGVKIGTLNWLLDDIYNRTYYARLVKTPERHPDFNLNVARSNMYSDMVGDIGLLIFDDPLPSSVTPLQIISENGKIPTRLQVAGYGVTKEGGDNLSPTLREVALSYIQRSKCNSLLNKQAPNSYNLTDASICAGDLAGGKDACTGDSGGPLFIKGKNAGDDVLVGLTSFGEGCAHKNVPAGYTNIQRYLPWIKSKVLEVDPDYKF